jgi:hypothetical protein
MTDPAAAQAALHRWQVAGGFCRLRRLHACLAAWRAEARAAAQLRAELVLREEQQRELERWRLIELEVGCLSRARLHSRAHMVIAHFIIM